MLFLKLAVLIALSLVLGWLLLKRKVITPHVDREMRQFREFLKLRRRRHLNYYNIGPTKIGKAKESKPL